VDYFYSAAKHRFRDVLWSIFALAPGRRTKLLLIDAGRELAASLSFRARCERETKSAISPPKFPDIHLFREAYTPHQVVEARVGAQWVKGRINFEIQKPRIMRFI
jgi:hypothetical protein